MTGVQTCALPIYPLANGGTLSNGNLYFTTGATHALSKSTYTLPLTGLWYAEAKVLTTTTGSIAAGFGVGISSLSTTAVASSASGAWEIYASSSIYFNRNGTQTSITGTFSAGDTLQIAFDSTNSKSWVGINNIWYDSSNGTTGNPSTGSNATFTSLPSDIFVIANTYSNTLSVNFGQKPFKFPPPAGFQPLTLANTPRPTIVRPDQYVGVTTYTGTGATQSINTGFQPDLVWVKQRTSAASHVLVDTVRGAYKLSPNQTLAEISGGAFYGSVSPTSNGFSLVQGSDTDPSYGGFWEVGANAKNYVAWAWKAGGSGGGNSYWINGTGYSTASAAGLTAGTITPTGASVNTKSGFSIITYTGNGVAQASGGASISHGLNSVPKLMIVKSRDTGSTNWSVWHSSLTAAGYSILLNDPGGESSGATADRKSTRLNSSHIPLSRMPSSA